MKLFDSNACFGMDMVNHECVNHENFIVMEKVDIAKTADELISEMDRVGIERAVVMAQSAVRSRCYRRQ